jgi:nuclear protein localization family protein 4
MIVRIRTQLGTWRLKEVQSTDSIGTLRQRVEEEHMTDLCGRPLTRDPAGLEALPNELTVAAAKVGNGDMLYAMIDEAKTGVHELAKTKRSITKDGNIIALDYHSNAAQTGFRPGMLPLKSMKMQWTLNEFMSLDEQFIYKMKRQDEAICKGVSLDNASIGGFVKYMANFDYQKIRVGYLYGYFEDDNKVKVECIYEPPQETTDKQFTLLEDPLQERVEKVALSLGLRRVGWVYSHPPREKGFFMSALEVLTGTYISCSYTSTYSISILHIHAYLCIYIIYYIFCEAC